MDKLSEAAPNKKRDAALRYARDLGWRVFPLVPNGKPPLTAHGFKDASTDPERIREWWTQTTDANIGVATGAPSDVTVIDVDIKPWKGKTGDKTLAALVAAHDDLPETPRQRTWSGGLQYFFTHVPGLKNFAGAPGTPLAFIDGKNDGGYAVLPPSTVEEDGRSGTYAWLLSPSDVPLAVMPTWLIDAIQMRGGKLRAHGPSLVTNIRSGHLRNNSMTSLGGTMRRAGFGEESIAAALLTENEQSESPLDEDEVRGVARSVARYEPAGTLTIKVGADGELTKDERPLSEGGDAERMQLLYGDRFRWVAEEKTWLAWDGKRWARDSRFQVQRFARETVLALQHAALALAAPAVRSKVLSHALRADSSQGIDGIVKIARYLPGVTIAADALDADPDALNVANGTLDLRTFELRAHEPARMLTRLVNVPYEPQARAPRWETFLLDVFRRDADLIEFVQRCVGYTLTARVDEQVVFFLHGGGQNGKSTFVAALDALLGEYATNAGKETFLASLKNEGRGPEPELMRLSGKRFAYVNEADEGRALDEARIKALTGGATTTARDLYKTTETFTNTAKVWFDLNTLPAFKGIDYGIERRLVVIPFDWKVPDIGRVGDMAEQLKAELPGILAWAVDGCRRWRLSGLQQRPAGVAVATRRYRDENNHLPAFVEETYMLSSDGTVTVADLQRDYAGFCERRGETALAYKQKMIPYLRDVLGLEPSKTKVARLWRGIASRPAE